MVNSRKPAGKPAAAHVLGMLGGAVSIAHALVSYVVARPPRSTHSPACTPPTAPDLLQRFSAQLHNGLVSATVNVLHPRPRW